MLAKFIGRERELGLLKALLNKKTASIAVLKGRRRIGKSRLAEEFAKDGRFYRFSGLPPTAGMTAQHQRDEFAFLLNQQTGLPEIQTDDWSKLFLLLHEKVKTGRVVILIDEITWMAQGDPSFLPKLKNAWDLYFSKNNKLILIFCGSISAWIEKNIMSSTGYFGRVSQKITLGELPINHCNALLESMGFKYSAYEKFMVLALTGGVPWYIEQINASYNASQNIGRLCFDEDSILFEEHDRIFHDLFGPRSEIYEKITKYLANGSAEYKSIAEGINYSSSGALSVYIDDLIISGYVRRDDTWSFKTGRSRKIAMYRLADNYLRFYYKYILPKSNQIKSGQYKNINVSQLPGWEAMMGLQFENLVLNNRDLIHAELNIQPEDIVSSNPYYQRKTTRYVGCQIDYLIQTRFNTIYVCEIKFSKNAVPNDVVSSVQDKIKKLALPHGFSCLPILIHVNGVSESIVQQDYFLQCIDFQKYLT